jgi:hypothetical protein
MQQCIDPSGLGFSAPAGLDNAFHCLVYTADGQGLHPTPFDDSNAEFASATGVKT